MKKNKFFISLCLSCMFLVSCAGKNIDAPAHVDLENPLIIPITHENPSFYIISSNKTAAREDIKGLLTALLQSDYGIRLADSAAEADYVVRLTVETFHTAGRTEAPVDAASLALPIIASAAGGAQIGAEIDGGEGALYGAGIGLVVGLGIGLLTQDGDHIIWRMTAQVDVEHKGESFTSRIDARVQDEYMDAAQAALALEDKVARAIAQAFRKEY